MENALLKFRFGQALATVVRFSEIIEIFLFFMAVSEQPLGTHRTFHTMKLFHKQYGNCSNYVAACINYRRSL
jgi:hypothetical protein